MRLLLVTVTVSCWICWINVCERTLYLFIPNIYVSFMYVYLSLNYSCLELRKKVVYFAISCDEINFCCQSTSNLNISMRRLHSFIWVEIALDTVELHVARMLGVIVVLSCLLLKYFWECILLMLVFVDCISPCLWLYLLYSVQAALINHLPLCRVEVPRADRKECNRDLEPCSINKIEGSVRGVWVREM